MSKISNAIVETLLEEITDYSKVELDSTQLDELCYIADQWSDKESIESEINIYLQNIGYFYDEDNCLWDLPKHLKITKERFLDWYFNYGQDEENKELRVDLANSIIDQMYKVGFGSFSVVELFDNCNQESIRAYFTQEYDMQTDEFDIELSDLGFEYTITLID